MVKCNSCGNENQPAAVYCSNCGITVHMEQAESLRTAYRARMAFIVGAIVGILLIGLGLVISLFSADIGMAGSEAIGYALLVSGILVLLVGFLMYGRLRSRD